MAKFLTGNELEDAICDIVWNCEETLLIVSPYIKLDDYFKVLFDKQANNPDLSIIIVFGKNEGQISKSMSKNDFEYFKKFLNISIVYVPNLHAKYYGNEKKGIITSVNFYDFSFKNNIEFGVFYEYNALLNINNSIDKKAWETCMHLAYENEAVFIKRPVFQKKKILSSIRDKTYIKSDVLHDVTDKFYKSWGSNKQSNVIKRMSDFDDTLELGFLNKERPTREMIENPVYGFCIRTGEQIPFNPSQPLSDKAYRTWLQFKNPNYPESFCHKTGKPSNGKTSVNNPILH